MCIIKRMTEDFNSKILSLQKKYEFVDRNIFFIAMGIGLPFSVLDTLYLRKYRKPNSNINTYIQYGIGAISTVSVISYIEYQKKNINKLKEEHRQFKLLLLNPRLKS